MEKREMRRIMSVLLIAVMLFTTTGVSVFAEERWGTPKEKLNLLVFGASTSSGYGLSDYNITKCGFDIRNNDLTVWDIDTAKDQNAARISDSSYIWKLKQHMAEKNFGYDPEMSADDPGYADNHEKLNKVHLDSLALEGMRTDELRAFLDETYYRKSIALEKEKTWYYADGKVQYCGFLGEHIDSFTYSLGMGGAVVDDGHGNEVSVWNSEDQTVLPGGKKGTYDGGPNYDRACQYIKERIQDADVIVLDPCMNNFGTYLAERIAGYAKTPGFERSFNYHKETLDDIDGVNPKVQSMLKVLKTDLIDKTDYLKSETAKVFVDSFLYCYADCATNFSACVDLIKEINPNAVIIAQGVYNTLDGVDLIIDGQTIDFGSLTATGFGLVNAYIKGLDKNSPNYYYSDLSAGIQTFMDQIVFSDSYDELVSDPEGKTMMDKYYDSFNQKFMGGAGDLFAYPPSVVYEQLLVSNFSDANITLPEWDSLGADDKIIGSTYLGQELKPVKDAASAATHGMMTNAHRISYGESMTLLDAWKAGLISTLDQETQQDLINAIDRTATGPEFYEILKMIYGSQGIKLEDLDTEKGPEDTDPITGTTFITMDTTADSIADAIKPAAEEGKDVMYLTKDSFSSFAEGVIPNIRKLLYEAGKFTTIDLERVIASLADMNSVNAEIQRYMMSAERPSDGTMELLHVIDRFILSNGLGQHPSKYGCLQMADDVIAAYDKSQSGGFTAFEEVFEEYYPYLVGVALKIKEAKDNGDIDKLMNIISKLDEIGEMISVIDEQGLSADQLEKLFAMKDKLEEGFNKALEAVGLTEDELIKQAAYIRDNTDWEKVAECVRKLVELAYRFPELYDKYEPVIRDIVDKNLDDITEKIQMIREMIREATEGKDYEQIIEDLKPVFERLKAIGLAVYELPEYEKALDEYSAVVDQLMSDAADMKDRVSDLEQELSNMKAEKEANDELIAKLRAKSIRAELTSKVTFPSGKVKVEVSWDKDPDAAGYELKVNGKAVSFEEKETGFVYTDAAAEVKETYKFEVTPFVYHNDKIVPGNTYKTSVTPKVSVKKASIKKVKAGTKKLTVNWKKVSGANGYQVSCKTGSKTIKKMVNSAKKVKLTVKGLKSGKKYTVKVRAWKKVNGKKYYGKWSSGKKVTVK